MVGNQVVVILRGANDSMLDEMDRPLHMVGSYGSPASLFHSYLMVCLSNMVLDDDDYELIEENNPGFRRHTSENCKRLKKVRIDVGARPLDGCGGDGMDASTAKERPTTILNGLGFNKLMQPTKTKDF
ncbi:ABC transporter F family member 1-like protein [Tanacetum coccineum]